MLAPAKYYWNLIRSARRWLAVTLGHFFLALAAGLVLGIAKPSLIQHLQEQLGGGRETGFPAFIRILKHNLKVLLISWCGGLVPAISPLFATVAVGCHLGGLLGLGSVSYWCLAILPHGIVEIPAILLGNAFFLRLGLRWMFQKTATARKRTFLTDFQDSVKISLLCMFLFTIAALIESFATPKLLAPYENAHLAGIGVQIAVQEHQLTLTHVFPGGPASKAGLCSGLLIRRIDDTETTGKGAEQCRDMTHGRVGTKVKLEVVDPAHSKTNMVELVRELKP
jgi:stage II sporulation protein M